MQPEWFQEVCEYFDREEIYVTKGDLGVVPDYDRYTGHALSWAMARDVA